MGFKVKKKSKHLRNSHKDTVDSLSVLDRAALWITSHIGTMGFFLLILAWSIVWLAWNVFAPAPMQFDPAPAFVFWLFVSNLIQILLMPLLLVGQNIQSKHSEIRAEVDLAVNIRSEKEVKLVIRMLQEQRQILEKMIRDKKKGK
jgi:uncharacterized membrane protein